MDRDLESRIAGIESRLARLEARFAQPAPAMPPQAAPAPASPPPPRPAVSPAAPAREVGPSFATSVLGWGGGIALVLAAVYLIRLGVDSGWLTPVRQVALAAIAGLALIVAGFALRGIDRQYAGLLPAAGVAILFLSVYGAHLYYGFIGAKAAAAAVVAICALSLWLCRAFESDLYALFAVAGSYSAPFLLAGLRGSITDLVVYFSAWSAVFSVFAIWHGRRLIYLLALYLALPGFDLIWRQSASPEWVAAFSFQTVQFAIFGIATAVFSIRHDAPLEKGDAFAHLPPLLLFYFLQYGLLDKHLPAYAPWIAVASAALLALIYAGARVALQRPLPGGELILWSYLALVLFHAGYIEMVPRHWAPWVAFLLVPVLAVVSLRRGGGVGGSWPLWVAVGLIFGVNYLRVIFDTDVQGVPARSLLAVAYAALLYVGYLLSRGNLGNIAVLALYAGHISAMAAALHLLDQRIVQSVAWGVLALGCLGLSLMQRDRALGQSSLLVFGATAAKVLLYDLSGAPPVARIVSLAVLGVTFYAGGMLYQRMLVAKQP
jgi:uncharacterized membrane protein